MGNDMNYDAIIQTIVTERKLTLVDCRIVDYPTISSSPAELTERDSYITSVPGGYEIILGRYPGEDEVRLAAFFHEVGHIPSAGDYYLDEKDAWNAGLALASSLGIEFSSKVYAYIDECLQNCET